MGPLFLCQCQTSLNGELPLKGDSPQFSPVLAKSNQSTRSIHRVSTEASPFINVIPWETISSIDNRKNKYFCWEKKMKTKVRGNHVMGWVREEKESFFFFPLSSFSPKQSLYRTCLRANLFDMEKMWKQSDTHTHTHTHTHTQRGICARV